MTRRVKMNKQLKTFCTLAVFFIVLLGLGVHTVDATSITTTFASNNSMNGNMFDVTIASNNIDVTSLDINSDGTGTRTLEVYTRVGGWSGFETNSAAWTLQSSNLFTGAGLDNQTQVDISNILLNANTTYGFYVTVATSSQEEGNSDRLGYTNGSNVFTNSDITITTGIGISYPFGAVFSPRTWNGTLYYDLSTNNNTVPEPATVALLGIGLVGLAGVAARRKWKKKAVDKS